MSIATKLLTFFFLITHLSADFCYFIPPKDWDLADPEKLSPRVKVCFIGPSSGGLLPSVNLATEDVNISLKEYLIAVRKIYESDPNIRWRDLGKFNTSLGEGRLTEIEAKSEYGRARQVQLIVVKDQMAYILTAGSLKEEFSQHFKEFDAVLHSLRLVKDLTDPLSSEKKEELLHLVQKAQFELEKTSIFLNIGLSVKEKSHPLLVLIQEKPNFLKFVETLQSSFIQQEIKTVNPSFETETWEPLQEKIITDFTEMGPYWQILLLKDLQTTLARKTS